MLLGGGFCGAAFCGWCFADCGDDAHAHVVACPHNAVGGRYYGALELFEQACRASQTRALHAYLATLDSPLRVALRAALRRDLLDLGIDLAD